jgi:trehalose/maltose hydrolase-like predicted phosphorylase
LGVEINQWKSKNATRCIAKMLQAASPLSASLDAGFPARNWEEAYGGQIFWDSMLSCPFFDLRFPEVSRRLISYRWQSLDAARRAAAAAGFHGAMFPWRSAQTGEEVTPEFEFNPISGRFKKDVSYLQRHIGASIAHSIWCYVNATNDIATLEQQGAELILEIARFYASAVRNNSSGGYDLGMVVGPDEFHTLEPISGQPGLTNNAYTNVMAARTFQIAFEALDRIGVACRERIVDKLKLTEPELSGWDDVSRNLRIDFHDGVVSQFQGFELLKPLNIEEFKSVHHRDRIDWALEAEGDDVERYAACKQPDFIMLLYIFTTAELLSLLERLGYKLTLADLRRSVDYYLARTSHDSSLSLITTAGALSRLDPDRSWRTYVNAPDPETVPAGRGGAHEGVHLGAMAGCVDVLQRCYFGISVTFDGVQIEPALPSKLENVSFGFCCHFGRFEISWNRQFLTLQASANNSVSTPVSFCGKQLALAAGQAVKVEANARLLTEDVVS